MPRDGLPDDPLWYKDAIIYEMRIRAFYDSDGDGVGDFRGATEKLDYLHDLGVNAVWLLPFYPSPLKDDGYDISDTMRIHPDVGTLEDFRVFLREAHARGIRVITELVLNHTSNLHQRFQIARRAPPGSPERDFYVWSDTPERYPEARIIFKDFEQSNWTWDPLAQSYFWHRFYSHQPDLNFDNPEVRRFIRETLLFWLELGVDGLRLDAVPYLYEREGTNCENLSETHDELQSLRAFIDARFQNRMLLAEANQWPEDAVAYFGKGDECHMAFHFPVMPRLFMAIRMEDRFPIIEIISQTPPIPPNCQWALFLRNHDELTLEMVTDEERDYMYRVYAEDPHARINLGIRHRLAPLMNNDRRRMELLNGLLFSLPGTPVLYYGDEIGMGDNIFLGDRNGVRTPMQWSSDRNAGFSRVNPQRLYLPVIVDPQYHYETVNVENQLQTPTSLLCWTRSLISLRKEHPAFGRGEIEFLYPENRKVLTFVRQDAHETLLIVANLSQSAQYVELDLSRYAGRIPIELLGRTFFPTIGELPYLLTLGAYGFYWFQLETSACCEKLRDERPLATLPSGSDWRKLFDPTNVSPLESLILPYLQRTGWYSGDLSRLKRGMIVDRAWLPTSDPENPILLAFVDLDLLDGQTESIFLPLAWRGDPEAEQQLRAAHAPLFARLSGERDGLLYDAAYDPRFCRALAEAIAREQPLRTGRGAIEPTRLSSPLPPPTPDLAIPRRIQQETGSTRSISGPLQTVCYHPLEWEPHPDLELTRLLDERLHFPQLLPPIGYLEYRRPRREPAALAIVRQRSPAAILAWTLAVEASQTFIVRASQASPELLIAPRFKGLVCSTPYDPAFKEWFGPWLDQIALLGRRTAELHKALVELGRQPDLPEFAPLPFDPFFRRSRFQSMRNQVRKSFELLRKRRSDLSEPLRSQVEQVVGLEEEALRYCKTFLDNTCQAQRIRHHGRWRLREILYDRGDFFIPNFEGEPTQPLSTRRSRRSPIRDVVQLMRGLRYAAHAPLLEMHAAGTEEVAFYARLAKMWQCLSSETFWNAYLPLIEPLGLIPSDPKQRTILFETYFLDEMVFGIQYELLHRPTWLPVVLDAIQEILSKESSP